MKQVNDLYQSLVLSGTLRGVRRFNLRKFCRSFNLPACGIAFWLVDTLDLDYLSNISRSLPHDQICFRGGEYFPRAYWDMVALGQEQRSEFVFLTTAPNQHRSWQTLLGRGFADSMRGFGRMPAAQDGGLPELQPALRTMLVEDLIHFAGKPDLQSRLGDFYLALYCLTFLKPPPDAPTRERVLKTTLERHPNFRSDMARVLANTNLEDRLNDLLNLMHRLPSG